MEKEITRETFVGREQELEQIRQDIEEAGFRVISVQGEGGIGKTSLLNQIYKAYHPRDTVHVTPILDFFSTTTHTPDGFLELLVEEFPPAAFTDYREQKEQYDIVRLAGMPGNVVEDHRERAIQAFRSDFLRLAQSHKIVLLIDTFEVVQDDMASWLQELMAQLEAEAGDDTKGMIFIIAGRRNEEWNPALIDCFSEQVTCLSLYSLEEEEVDQLFDEVLAEVPESERQKVGLLTGRHPLLIAMSVDWRNLQNISFEHLTETTERYTLNDLQQMSPDQLAQARREFESELVEKFRELRDPTDKIIWEMAYVYKRFDADVLSYLHSIPNERARELLTGIESWSFIKHDPRTGMYQLHDKMRDMVLQYIWPRQDPDRSQRTIYSVRMVEYYEGLLDKITQKIEQRIEEGQKARARKDRQVETEAKRAEIAQRTLHNVLSAHQAYYDILANPEQGLLRCNEAITDDIWAHNVNGYTLKKREREDALNVLGRELPAYVRDLEKARVLIVIEQNRREALDLLGRLDDPDVFALPGLRKSTHQADVKIYQSFAVCYGLPPIEHATEELRVLVERWVGERSPFERAAELAQEAANILRQQERMDLNELERRAIDRSLARAYGAQAYALARMGRLMDAVQANRHSLGYARRGELPAGQSHALNDLAYGYARLGKFAVAKHLVREALTIRERLGLDYYIGLSYNTLGLIQFLHDQPHRGRVESEQALNIFQRLNDQRGLGLAHLALGKIKGRMGEVRSERRFLEEALDHYEIAIEIFSGRDERGELVEPARLSEAYEWRAILHLIWGGRFLSEMGASPAEIEAELEKADAYFEWAVQRYAAEGREWEQAIALERWARVYIDRGEYLQEEKEEKQEEFTRTEEKLDRAEEIILTKAPEIKFRPQRAAEAVETEEVHPEYRLALGKVERLRGRLAFDQIPESSPEERPRHLEEAARHFTLACAYLRAFSEQAGELQTALDLLGERIRLLEYKEVLDFNQYIDETQEQYGLPEYEALSERIRDIASLEMII